MQGFAEFFQVEVENVLAAMPQIAEAAVVGMPDPKRGEAVCVVARLNQGQSLTLADVVAHGTGKLGKFKLPKKLVLTDPPLPRTLVGRVLKRLLRNG